MPIDRPGGPFVLEGREVYLRAGELQYFRVRPELWRPALEHLRVAGFNAVATYVPWIVHEPAEGTLDFEGATAPAANLAGFLETCREVRLPVMIRPGPQIYAEFRGFGLPLWLGQHYPECVMRGPRGRLVKGSFYYYYALLHPTYLTKVAGWLGQMAALLWPRFADVIISWQLDNETGMPLGNTLGNFDFNPDTVTRFRRFLTARYGDDTELRRAWGRERVALETALPPRRPARIAEATDWYDFLEGFVTEYLARLREIAQELGIPVPLVINDLDIYLSPVAPARKRGLAQIQGYDIYTKGSGTPSTADMPFAPSHDPERFRALVGPEATFIAPEMGAGWFDPRARIKPEATVQATLGGVAHGLQGHSYYVAHDGRDPDGSPYTFHSLFDERGRPTGRLRAVARMHELLAAHEAELLASEAVYDDVLYLTYQPYARLLPDDYLPGQLLPDPLRYLEAFGLHGFYDVLLTAGYLPRFADLGTVRDAELAAARAVIFPTRGWLDTEALAKLVRYVGAGGHLVTFPTIVQRDDHGRQLPAASAIYPLAAERERRLGGGAIWRRLVIDLLVKYGLWERWRLARREPAAMQNTDAFEGLKVLLNQRLPAATLRTRDGAAVRGDYRLVTFARRAAQTEAAGAIVEDLTYDGRCAGYTLRRPGSGTSAVIGAVVGGAYTTGVYYQLAEIERAALRGYAQGLLNARGVRPRWWGDAGLEVECVLRRVPHGYLLFVLNRLGEQVGTLELAPDLGRIQAADLLWTYSDSSATLTGENTLRLALRSDDVLVLRLACERQD